MTLNLTDPAVKAAIESLEQDSELKPIEKANILMTADGKKLATWPIISSSKWAEGSEETRISSERWQELENLFKQL